MKISVSVNPRSDGERDHLARTCPELFKKHTIPIRELLSNLFLLNVNCVRPEEFHEKYTKLDDEDHAGLDNLADTYTSIPTFVGLMRHAASDWTLTKLNEKGFTGTAKIKESSPTQSARNEFVLPAGIQAIPADEIRALLGDRQVISANDLAKLIQEGRAYEETLQPMGWRVVVIYVRNEDGSVHTLLVQDDGKTFQRLRYFLRSRQAALIYFFTIDVDPNDAKNAKNAKAAITAPSKYRTTVRVVDAIGRIEEDPTRIIDLIREYVEANVPGEGQELANAILDFIALVPPEYVTLILDFLQLVLDIVGMFPGAGEPVDIANAAISGARGQVVDAAFGVAAAIPVVGTVPGLGKALWRIKTILNFITDLPKSLQELFFDLLSGIQDRLLSFTLSKIPDFVRALKRLIVEATERLDVLATSITKTPVLAAAGNFPPPSSITKNITPRKSIKVELPPSKSQPVSKRPNTPASKPKSDSDTAVTPPPKQPIAEPTKVQPAAQSKQAQMPTRSAASKKKKAKRTRPPQKKRARKSEKREQRKSRAKAKKKAKPPAKARTLSPLVVVKRRKMAEKTRKVKGQKTTTYGQPDSSSTTAGHADTIVRKSNKMVNTGDYDYITMQRSWRTATGRVSKERKMPDLIGVRRDGTVDAFEVESSTDDVNDLKSRLKDGMHSLPKDRRGEYDVIMSRPNNRKSSKGSKTSKTKHRTSRKQRRKN